MSSTCRKSVHELRAAQGEHAFFTPNRAAELVGCSVAWLERNGLVLAVPDTAGADGRPARRVYWGDVVAFIKGQSIEQSPLPTSARNAVRVHSLPRPMD